MKRNCLSIYAAISLLIVCFSAVVALAGGFHIEVSAPDPADTKFKDSAIVVRTFECNKLKDIPVAATAEGMVNGRRQSVTLQLKPISPGVYAITRQWPAKGNWVVAISSELYGNTRTALVELGPQGEVRTASN